MLMGNVTFMHHNDQPCTWCNEGNLFRAIACRKTIFENTYSCPPWCKKMKRNTPPFVLVENEIDGLSQSKLNCGLHFVMHAYVDFFLVIIHVKTKYKDEFVVHFCKVRCFINLIKSTWNKTRYYYRDKISRLVHCDIDDRQHQRFCISR